MSQEGDAPDWGCGEPDRGILIEIVPDPDFPDLLCARFWSGLSILRYTLDNVYLDLTPPDPPLSRVDGLDVGLRVLVDGGTHAIAVVLRDPNYEPCLIVGERTWRAKDYPALAGIDPASPTALREAVVAVLRAGGAR
jgi:hypothetical protein